MIKRSCLFLVVISLLSHNCIYANEPDSAYIFSYATEKNQNHNGLHYAWSVDQESWHGIGPEMRFLFSDFGAWGSQKRMISPFMFKDQNNLWHCLWTLNNEVGQFAHADTKDMYNWRSQSYPTVMSDGNVLDLEVSYNKKSASYLITWASNQDGKRAWYKTTTTDFKTYKPTQKAIEKERLNIRTEVVINGEKQHGVVQKVAWETIDKLIKHQEWTDFHNKERAEETKDDPIRFKGLKDLDAELTLYPEKSKEISDMLIGAFFEDINYAADGGLYAELIQNRGFEYDLSDKQGRDNSWTHKKSWFFEGKGSFEIDTLSPIHKNNKHFAVVEVKEVGAVLMNEGFDAIPVVKGQKYNFSVFAKRFNEDKSGFKVSLIDAEGNVIGESSVKKLSADWKKYETVITAAHTVDNASIQIQPYRVGKYALDMVSLFPQNTFMGRKNGLRKDLAQVIADIKPRFVRFPGGCVTHGNGIDNIYHWKNTIGPLEARKPQRNIWNYHQSMGLGYFEYFQFCEDIDAEPVPVVAAGVPCQNSSIGGHGQQGGIPMCEMGDYVQEVLDLIEWANGDKNTKWGKIRAEAGHPKPFNLKYIGIGNEDLITDIFAERFTMIYNAVQEKYPEITVIGTVGPFYMGTDYVEGWKLATELKVPMVDEHYYQPPGWFINNQDYYDRYDRNKSKVYLGEYASHLPGRPMNIETALSEALYLTAVERNADIVTMTSFAPLLAKEHHTQWNPDLIYFNNTEVKPTVDYYVQKMYGNNSGDQYIPGNLKLSTSDQEAIERVAFSVVKDAESNDLIVKLVNMLPVKVNASLNLDKFIKVPVKASLTVLKGKPTSKDAKPEESVVELDIKPKLQLAPYSFSLIRVSLD